MRWIVKRQLSAVGRPAGLTMIDLGARRLPATWSQDDFGDGVLAENRQLQLVLDGM
jgi:hypothetical protein